MLRRLMLAALGFLLFVQWCAAQPPVAQTPAAKQPAAQPPAAQPTSPSAPAAPAANAEAEAAFKKVFDQWKELLDKLEKLQVDYKSAKPEDRKPIRLEFEKLVQQGMALEPELVKVAEAAYRAAPNKSQDVTDVLVSALGQDLRDDNYEQALPIAKLLVDNKFENARIFNQAGLAAYETNDYDAATEYLGKAEKASALDDMGERTLHELPNSKKEWDKEKAVREKEAKADDLPRVEIKTNKGTIVVELFENEAPNTVANFINLVEKKFYNGTPFHRVLEHFMAQGGDPQGTGAGGPGYSIACECYKPERRAHFRGSLSMAHAGRDTGGSQFFLTFVRTPNLDYVENKAESNHTVFGRVISGLDVLSKILRRDPREHTEPDKIIEATVLRKRNHPYEPTKIAEPAKK